MTTVAQVNKALKALGAEEKLVRGEGYYYFVNGTAEGWESASVMTNSLTGLTTEDMLEEWRHRKAEFIARA